MTGDGTRASILLVDDRAENLLALQAILEPLGQRLVSVTSGDAALRELLREEFAAILLDVQMPGLDGFQTAELIKKRDRTRHTPIIFLTALSKDAEHVFRGYETGAVDYLLKPFDPDVLRSKVAVFVDLWEKEQRLQAQASLLREQKVEEAVRESEVRYRTLAEALPALVWRSDAEGNPVYYNERWHEYTGISADADAEEWDAAIHPEDRDRAIALWDQSIASGEVFENEARFRRRDGVYRWHLARAVPVTDPGGGVSGWVGTAIDIDDRKRAEESQRFLVEAGALLGRSLDYEQTLADVARAAVPAIADWCLVDMVDEKGTLRAVAVAHGDPLKEKLVRELRERYPPDRERPGAALRVLLTGEPQVATVSEDVLLENARDEMHLELLHALELRAFMSVPLRARGDVVGAITFVQAESGRTYRPGDLELVEELARRAGTAIENAQLYHEVEERARAARVLAAVGDGVVLVDRDGVIRLWNPAAARITGVDEAEVVGRKIDDVVPRWADIAARIPVASSPGEQVRADTTPVEIAGRELWISGSGVGVEEGTVYAFRDLTEERALEQLKSDFVATVSHEIRTPLAAVHGSALTLLRADLELTADLRARLLEVIAEESDRLAQIVNDLLIASHLDSGRLPVAIESCDARELAEGVLEAAKTHVPDQVELRLEGPKRLAPVAADPGQLRQVLANLVDNAIKYSPEGGPVTIELQEQNSHVRFAVSDRGLGIPSAEHRRVFEKFYRLDPHMTRGIGGTGLGLYISRELVRNMNGRIWVESSHGEGSTFFVEIPMVENARRKPAAKTAPRKKHASRAA